MWRFVQSQLSLGSWPSSRLDSWPGSWPWFWSCFPPPPSCAFKKRNHSCSCQINIKTRGLGEGLAGSSRIFLHFLISGMWGEGYGERLTWVGLRTAVRLLCGPVSPLPGVWESLLLKHLNKIRMCGRATPWLTRWKRCSWDEVEGETLLEDSFAQGIGPWSCGAGSLALLVWMKEIQSYEHYWSVFSLKKKSACYIPRQKSWCAVFVPRAMGVTYNGQVSSCCVGG